MNKKELELYSWVVRGSQRVAILRVLDRPMTPKQIAEKTKIKFSNVSDSLKLLGKKDLSVCINPKEKTGRLYQLTKKGSRIRDSL